MFPAGAPGAGLVLLRVCAATASTSYLLSNGSKPSAWVVAALVLVALFLLSGLLTPIACIGAVIIQSLSAVQANFLRLSCGLLGVLLLITVLLLGPGAYSLDALLFGRRRVVVPRS